MVVAQQGRQPGARRHGVTKPQEMFEFEQRGPPRFNRRGALDGNVPGQARQALVHAGAELLGVGGHRQGQQGGLAGGGRERLDGYLALRLGEGLQGLGRQINGHAPGDGAPAAGVITGGQFLGQCRLHRLDGGRLPGELEGRRRRHAEEKPGRGRAGLQALGGQEIGDLAAVEFEEVRRQRGGRAADIPGFANSI